MTKTGPSALLGVLLLGLADTLSPARAQTPSIPVPAPAQRERPAAVSKDTQFAGKLAQSTAAIASPPPAVNPVPTPAVGQATALDGDQRAILGRVSAYLSNVHNMVGKFVQVGPDGTRTTGEFYIQKPGKVRFEYDPPNPVEIVADGSQVAVRDSKLGTQNLYALSDTPLRFLLADRIDLLHDTNVVGVSVDDVFVSVVIEEHSTLVGTNRLMLMFAAKDLQLKQWTITDPQGYDTTVAIYDLDSGKRPDPSLFRIDYDRPDRTVQ